MLNPIGNKSIFDSKLRAGFERQLLVAGEPRDVILTSTNGTRVSYSLFCVFSIDAFKDKPLAGADGGIYYQGDAMLSVRQCDLGATPVPNQIIETPAGVPYRIVDVDLDVGVYYLTLVKHV